MALLGFILLLIGLLVMNAARNSDGIGAAAFFLLGLLLSGFGIYALFFEQGEGARPLLESLGL